MIILLFIAIITLLVLLIQETKRCNNYAQRLHDLSRKAQIITDELDLPPLDKISDNTLFDLLNEGVFDVL